MDFSLELSNELDMFIESFQQKLKISLRQIETIDNYLEKQRVKGELPYESNFYKHIECLKKCIRLQALFLIAESDICLLLKFEINYKSDWETFFFKKNMLLIIVETIRNYKDDGRTYYQKAFNDHRLEFPELFESLTLPKIPKMDSFLQKIKFETLKKLRNSVGGHIHIEVETYAKSYDIIKNLNFKKDAGEFVEQINEILKEINLLIKRLQTLLSLTL